MPSRKEIQEYFAKFGKQGGKARAKRLTPEQRSESARKASEARWAKTRALVNEITAGTKKLEKVALAKARWAKKKPSTK